MTETTPEKRDQIPSAHAAAINRAIALRFLGRYRGSRDSVEFRGGDVSDMWEPPSFQKLEEDYNAALADWIDNPIAGFAELGAIVDLLAVIAAEELLYDATGDSPIVGLDKDLGIVLRLLACVRNWVDGHEINEAVRDERVQRAAAVAAAVLEGSRKP